MNAMSTPTSAPPPNLTSEAFDEYLEAMHNHYLNRAKALHGGRGLSPQLAARFVLPSELTIATDSLKDAPQEAKDVLIKYDTDPNLHFMDQDAAYIAQKVDLARSKQIDPDEFDRLMDERADKNIADYTKTQQDTKERLKDLGHQHPDWQQSILNLFNNVSDFLLGPKAWMKIIDFIVDTVKNFLEWAGKVLGWFGGVISDVTMFFQSLGIS